MTHWRACAPHACVDLCRHLCTDVRVLLRNRCAYTNWTKNATDCGDFFTDGQAMSMYKKHVAKVLFRVNTITGTPYRLDPTIMGAPCGTTTHELAQTRAPCCMLNSAWKVGLKHAGMRPGTCAERSLINVMLGKRAQRALMREVYRSLGSTGTT